MKLRKAPSIESKFDAKKPLPPGKTKLSSAAKKKYASFWGAEMGKFLVKHEEERLSSLVCKTQSEYRKRLAEWKRARNEAIDGREASSKRQREDEANRYYACNRCGREANFDGRDTWSACDHNDRFIEQRDRRATYPEPERY